MSSNATGFFIAVMRTLWSAAAVFGLMLSSPRALEADASLVINRLIYAGADGSPTENCQALINTVYEIADASDANRYLIKLEPGIYDCGTQIVVLKDYVSLEGSGRATLVRGQGATVVELASNMELRSVRVENYNDACAVGSFHRAAVGGAFVNPTAVNTRLYDVHAEAVLCPNSYGYKGDQISDVGIEHSEIRGSMGAIIMVASTSQIRCSFSILQGPIDKLNPGPTATCRVCLWDATVLRPDCSFPLG